MQPVTITLVKPLKRGEQEITAVTLHEPNAGHLRGVSLNDCIQMQTDAVVAVVPRISDPKITQQEMATAVAPQDLLQMGAVLANFLLPPSALEEAAKSIQSLRE